MSACWLGSQSVHRALRHVKFDELFGGVQVIVTAGVILHLNGRFESVGEKRARRRA
jgi:hypothetical protein